jgi:regulator of sirC expression with transglutaminase-like and TPR domain
LLVELLGDDSAVVLANVRAEFARLGRIGRGALERAARGGSPLVRGRARQLLLELARGRAVRRLVRYAARGEHDLETGLFLLDAHGAPGEDLRGYRKVLDAFGDELSRRVGALPMGRRRVQELVDYLGEEVGFAGPQNGFHHPDNIYLHRAIDRREGMPLTLCAIYAFVARRAGLQAGLLPFPGHVLLSVVDGGERLILDPFGGGATLTERGCMHYLAQHGLPYKGEFFEQAHDRAMLLRQVSNLIQSCRMRARTAEAEDLELVLRVLSGGAQAGRLSSR